VTKKVDESDEHGNNGAGCGRAESAKARAERFKRESAAYRAALLSPDSGVVEPCEAGVCVGVLKQPSTDTSVVRVESKREQWPGPTRAPHMGVTADSAENLAKALDAFARIPSIASKRAEEWAEELCRERAHASELELADALSLALRCVKRDPRLSALLSDELLALFSFATGGLPVGFPLGSVAFEPGAVESYLATTSSAARALFATLHAKHVEPSFDSPQHRARASARALALEAIEAERDSTELSDDEAPKRAEQLSRALMMTKRGSSSDTEHVIELLEFIDRLAYTLHRDETGALSKHDERRLADGVNRVCDGRPHWRAPLLANLGASLVAWRSDNERWPPVKKLLASLGIQCADVSRIWRAQRERYQREGRFARLKSVRFRDDGPWWVATLIDRFGTVHSIPLHGIERADEAAAQARAEVELAKLRARTRDDTRTAER